MENQQPPADYQVVLADLEARREELDKAILVIRRIVGGDSQAPITGSTDGTKPLAHAVRQAAGLHPTIFFNMSVGDAAVKYLGIVKQDTSTPDIAKALQAHGLKSVAKDFTTTVFSALERRERTQGDIVRPKRGLWGLAAWYPGMRKPRKDNDDKKIADSPPAAETKPPAVERKRTKPVRIVPPTSGEAK